MEHALVSVVRGWLREVSLVCTLVRPSFGKCMQQRVINEL